MRKSLQKPRIAKKATAVVLVNFLHCNFELICFEWDKFCSWISKWKLAIWMDKFKVVICPVRNGREIRDYWQKNSFTVKLEILSVKIVGVTWNKKSCWISIVNYFSTILHFNILLNLTNNHTNFKKKEFHSPDGSSWTILLDSPSWQYPQQMVTLRFLCKKYRK